MAENKRVMAKPINFRTYSGFTLIEVLVAIVVLSIGLLGVAAVQVNTVKFNQVAQQRSIASQALTSMTDRMRSNLQGVRDGAYVNAGAYSAIAKPVLIECSTGTCTPAQIAQRDLHLWFVELENSLSGGKGMISRPTGLAASAAGRGFVVSVMWLEKNTTDGLRATTCPPVAALANGDGVQCLSATFQP